MARTLFLIKNKLIKSVIKMIFFFFSKKTMHLRNTETHKDVFVCRQTSASCHALS